MDTHVVVTIAECEVTIAECEVESAEMESDVDIGLDFDADTA